jgi:hypothetical protein
MDVEIGEVVSSVRAVDGDALLSAPTMERIVRAVLRAMSEEERHRERVESERRISGGVRDEQLEDWR